MNLLNHTTPYSDSGEAFCGVEYGKHADKRRTSRSTLLFLFVCLVFAACRQPEKLKFPAALNSQRTGKHVKIPGTNISIVPPEDFIYWNEHQTFTGTGKDSCMIFITEDRSKNYFDYLPDFRLSYEKAYLSVVDETHHTINGLPATILFIHQDSRYDGYHILFGDSTFAAYIMTVQPNTAYRQKAKIFKSLTTVLYGK
jgi:hypothetical protein